MEGREQGTHGDPGHLAFSSQKRKAILSTVSLINIAHEIGTVPEWKGRVPFNIWSASVNRRHGNCLWIYFIVFLIVWERLCVGESMGTQVSTEAIRGRRIP